MAHNICHGHYAISFYVDDININMQMVYNNQIFYIFPYKICEYILYNMERKIVFTFKHPCNIL